MKRFLLVFALITLVPALVFGLPQNPKHHAVNYPALTGSEEVPVTEIGPVAPQVPVIAETDLIGDTFTMGNTWYGNQHNGTCGRMNVTESTGWRQFAWTKGYQAGAADRHIWWNGIDPNGVQVFPGTGVAVESSYRGGFVHLDVYPTNMSAIPAYHDIVGAPTNLPQTAVSVDLIPHSGAFLDFQAPPAPYTQIIWPRIAIGLGGRIHLMASQSTPAAANPQRQYYIGGTYNPTTMQFTYDPSWTFVDWSQTIAYDIATSPVTGNNKTLWVWTRSKSYPVVGDPNPDSTYTQINNDVYYLIDADGLNPNFSQKVNLTNFILPQLQYLPDTLKADRDTLRAYNCINAFIDQANYAHITFTTRSYFAIEGTTYWNASLIWHWTEQIPDSFRVVGGEEYFAFNNNVDCGAWNVKAQRPSLGQASNGTLYCMYQVYDTDTLRLTDPPDYMPSGEIYISKSTNNGINWTAGTNVTSTLTPYLAPAGQSNSELTPTMAKRVDTYCHVFYVLDKDAGNVLQTEGTWTDNPVRYHRVPVTAIAGAIITQTKRLHTTVGTDINVVMTPINPPIIIPANGGSFQFNAMVQRVVAPASPFWAWARNRYPNGTWSGILLGPVNINPPVGVTVTRTRTQVVNNVWPAGANYMIGYANTTAGVYPAIDADSFLWTKLTTSDGGPLVWEVANYGEEFPYLVGGSSTIPTSFSLVGASPNPFNPTTSIRYNLPVASPVKLTVFDASGREVATLVNGQREAGSHQVTFDGSNLSSGVYFYTLKAGANIASGKMALVK
jgi:hypothetical protein